MTYKEIIAYFCQKSTNEFRLFQQKLVTTKAQIIGVKIPIIKKFAHYLIKDEKNVFEILPSNAYLEVDLLKGFLISFEKCDYQTKLRKLEAFAKTIDNWLVCDTIVSSTRFKQSELNDLFSFSKKLLYTDNVFMKRFAIVIFIKYFSNTLYDEITEFLLKQTYGNYYFDMGVSWYYSVALVNDFDKTINNIAKIRPLSEFVYQKSLQKGIESLRISDEKKEILRLYKKLNRRD